MYLWLDPAHTSGCPEFVLAPSVAGTSLRHKTVFTPPHHRILHPLPEKRCFRGNHQSSLGLAAVFSGAEGTGQRSGSV